MPMPFCWRDGGNTEYGGPRSGVFLLDELDNGREEAPKKLLVKKGGPSLCMFRPGGGDMFWKEKSEGKL